MKVTLNIENDVELRAHIKDCIKGQVLSIVREELIAMVKAEFERKIKGTNEKNWELMQKQATKEAIAHILYKEHGVTRYSDAFIKPFVNEILQDALSNKNWSKMVDDLAKDKVKALIG